ncbi:diaminohydroxyphosphoribosylaminopyrimidine deaminase/5-amino-6-(5-phosphoribosylamino)uracil reductase [Scopulibacillus daqui]|uniref:Riboflavin biosynthesis protein RibD n=1 Tax=Scopulibacillus daqui TaxID=1469162 RepID=A0ABS2PZN8_9BACL|nr:bifunctional diaminohydroxyphosphoribosylaminopyrimidine deaminase/5-amino-6-(5-phosphoribosylamino)uracil reductase RibD [Scopulibacillus daqui]MBM7645351.1 diaminohydroxyphosphoribosylaminopyrimidine deaminase/5-amino-6-(5-phosphoribosylamino)uracil reductase [Scopulibacillus daqui]
MLDKDYMSLALNLVKMTSGQTSPNPAVGAVVVNQGKIVGIGAHLKAGEEHAEVHALNMAGDRAAGGTIYVTLEPCSHYGKTPPCADMIIERGISRAVIATSDPNPQVAGNGIQKLKNAGIEVVVGVMEKEARKYNQDFFHYMKTNRPFVTLKMAVSLDGKMATASGESQWITGPEARKDGHCLRHQHDAILVGIGTVLADNPSLTARLGRVQGAHPVRVILDSQLRTPLAANIVNDRLAPTWILTLEGQKGNQKAEALKSRGIDIYYFEDLSISNILTFLGKKAIKSLLVEGGAAVQDAFLQSRLIDQLVAYIAPKVIGGKDALTAFGGKGISKLADALSLTFEETTKIGDDIKIVAHVKGD